MRTIVTRIRRAVLTVAIALLIGAATPAAGALRVTVQPGDTLGAIAQRHGVSTAALAAANGIGDVHMIGAGRRLTIPSGGGAGAQSGTGGVYVVRPGDTLSAIAGRFGVSVGTITRANGLANAHRIVAGTRLRIAGASGVTAPQSATWIGGGVHTVRPGETLGAIAARYGTSAGALAAANGISDPNLVVAGTRLRVGAGASGAGAATGGGSASTGTGGYTVRPGDTLSGIAARFGTSAAAIMRANGLGDPNVIAAGTRLRIPGAAPSQGPLTPITAATAGWGNQPSRSTVAALMARAADRHGVDVALVRAIAWQESGWWQGSRSSSGAIGVMQLMPETAAWLGPHLLGRAINAYDAADNVEAGAAYLAYLLRQTGSRRLAIASYYQGMGSVTTRGLLPETEAYVASVASFIGRV